MELKYDLLRKDYLDYVGELRELARDKEKVSHGRPVLPLEPDSSPCIYVLLYMDGVYKGRAMIRRYDLRFMRYNGITPASNFGDFTRYKGVDVDDFNLYDRESKLVESRFDGLLLGLPTFIEAVNSLADIGKSKVDLISLENKSDISKKINLGVEISLSGARHHKTAASVKTSSLAVLCLVLVEAAKLELLSCWLNKAFKSKVELRLTSWLLKRINDWGDLSAELLAADLHSEDANCNFYLPDHENRWNDGRWVLGVTCQDIARCLGILRAVPPRPVPMVKELLQGSCLAEVYSVSVFFNGGRSGLIYGTIKIHTLYDTLYIYARDHTNCEPIESHGTLSLQGPNDAIFVNGHLDMELDLMEGGIDNKQVIKGKMMWDSAIRLDRYNARLSAFVKGKNGYAIVYYTVFDDAVLAIVEATLLAKEGHPDASHAVCVCGKLSAYYRDLNYPSDIYKKYYTTTLFESMKKEPSASTSTSVFGDCKWGQWVKPGESIKLSRSYVGVEVSDALIIKADLKSCEGKPIVTGSMEWLPRKLEDFQSIMKGDPNDSHILQVKVEWRRWALDSKSILQSEGGMEKGGHKHKHEHDA